MNTSLPLEHYKFTSGHRLFTLIPRKVFPDSDRLVLACHIFLGRMCHQEDLILRHQRCSLFDVLLHIHASWHANRHLYRNGEAYFLDPFWKISGTLLLVVMRCFPSSVVFPLKSSAEYLKLGYRPSVGCIILLRNQYW